MYWSSKQCALPGRTGPLLGPPPDEGWSARSGKEARDHGEAVGDGGRARRAEMQGRPLAGETVESLRPRPLAPDGPQGVREMLLHERHLGLDRRHHVAQAGARAAVRGHPGQDPGAPLLVHEAAGPVDRVHEDAQRGLRLGAPRRQHDPASREALRHQHDRPEAPQLALHQGRETLLADAIHRVDRVPLALVGHPGQVTRGGILAGLHHRGADLLVDASERRYEGPRLDHRPCSR